MSIAGDEGVESPMLFLTNFYYPGPQATGVCIHQLAKEITHTGKQAYVVCNNQGSEPKSECLDGIHVQRVDMPRYRYWNYPVVTSPRGLKQRALSFLGKMIGFSKKLFHFRKYPLRDGVLTRRYVRTVSALIEQHGIRTVVATFNPVECIEAGAILKKKYPQVTFVYYSLDTLSNEKGSGLLPVRFRERQGVKMEQRYFAIYDRVLLMNCHRTHYSQAAFLRYADKICYADFPLFSPIEGAGGASKDRNSIVYTGYLYRGIRNPAPVLRMLSPVLGEYTVHFYGSGDCDDILSGFEDRFPGRICRHGQVSHDRVIRAILSADVLLSIGNAGTDMAPSKIYEYMSTGKSILHFYADEQDPCLPVFEKYGNALCVKIGDEDAEQSIRDFLEQSHEMQVDGIRELFKTSLPSYTVDLIGR